MDKSVESLCNILILIVHLEFLFLFCGRPHQEGLGWRKILFLGGRHK